ncbi:SelEFf [Haematococcus lacustris]
MGSQAPGKGAKGPRILNVNVGVLGHVDSGKTSMVAALSTKLSTAALDKHPQSKERGITLDLGFSSFSVPLPAHLQHLPYDELQFTLVDCPGHASLIRTIIGGVQIIDMMVLVVDITKGLQTQTAECLVVGEVATSNMVVALNKCDLVPAEERPKAIRKAQKRLAQTFNLTKFAGVPMVPITAKPGGGGTGTSAAPDAEGLEELQAHLVAMVPTQPRALAAAGPLLFSIDHCFPIKGQGTVLTGTVLQGAVAVGDTIELPGLKLSKQVKSMQVFKRPVTKASQGDRVGICVTQLDPSLIERGLACAPGTVPTFNGAVAAVEKIRFYAGQVPSKAKFHVSVGHTTVMASLTFFGLPDGQGVSQEAALVQMIENLGRMALTGVPMPFDKSRDYVYQDQLHGLEGRPVADTSSLPQHSDLSEGEKEEKSAAAAVGEATGAAGGAQWEGEYLPEGPRHYGPQWVLLAFDQPVTAPAGALVIGAKFDGDIHGESCRLAFYGRLVTLINPSKPAELQQLRVYKMKEKRGVIERINEDQGNAIVRGMFKKETDPAIYTGLRVVTGRGEDGVIESSFGKSGKLKVHFAKGIQQAGRSSSDNAVILRCKRYIYEHDRKRLRQ